MDISAETISILVFLIPGFLSSILLDSFVVRVERSNFKLVIEGLIFSFFTYLIIFIWNKEWPISLQVVETGQNIAYSVDFTVGVLWQVALVSVILPIALAYSITHDLHMRLLRALRLTNLTARSNVWLDVFSNYGDRLVIANLKDGRRVIGWPMYYSDNVENQMLYLYNAAWVVGDGKYQPIPGHGLFIIEKDYLQTIEFSKRPKPASKEESNGDQ